MKIVLIWQPDSKTHVSIEGKSAEQIIAAAKKLVDYTTPAVVSVGNPPTTDMPNNPKNRPK